MIGIIKLDCFEMIEIFYIDYQHGTPPILIFLTQATSTPCFSPNC
jgi:hypothetical protein